MKSIDILSLTHASKFVTDDAIRTRSNVMR